LKTARKDQPVFPKRSLQSSRELATEHTAEHFHGEKECVARMNPVLMIKRKTTSWYHDVGMWMMQDVLTPRMQHAHEADLSAQMLGIGWLARQQRIYAGFHSRQLPALKVSSQRGHELVSASI
jgi:hypothetical protein